MRSFVNIVFFLVCIGIVYYFTQSSNQNEPSFNSQKAFQEYAVKKIKRLQDRVDMLEAELDREKKISRQLEFRLKEVNEDFIIQSDENGNETVRFLGRERVPAGEEPVVEPLVNNLVEQGVTEEVATEVFERIAEQKMELLELRDKATREGWIDTDEYRDQMSKLALSPDEIRTEFGDVVFDKYLYATGRSNRVLVQDIYPDSQAELVDIMPGDILVRYDDEAIFSVRDLRVGTAAGDRGESVTVDVLRNGEPLRFVVDRGPLGVKVDSVVQVPAGAK